MDLKRTADTIDGIFSDVLMKKISYPGAEKKMSAYLSATKVYDKEKHFEISIVDNSKKAEPFFGFRVFPVIADMEKLLTDATVEVKSIHEIINMWREIKNWYIEIDSTVFDRTAINFNPKELTALLLHEIGHTVFSDTAIERFYRAYKEAYVEMKSADRASIRALYVLYMIPLSIACSTRSWTNGKNEIKEEEYADKILVEKLGYTESLISAITKIIEAYGNSNVNITENEKESEVESSIRWANININDLVTRRKHLKDDLFYRAIRTNSNFFKAVALKIMNKLGVELQENYTGNIMESCMESLCDPETVKKYTPVYNVIKNGETEKAIMFYQSASAMESLHKVKPPEIPSQFDVDQIQIECDRIQNHSDRIYVLDLIYDELDQITRYREYIGDDKTLISRYEHKFASMEKQLDEIRKKVLEKRNFDKDYKVFVKYPQGYEG